MKFKGTFKTIDTNIKYNIQIGNVGPDCIITDPIDFNNDQLLSTGPIVMFDASPITISCTREDLTSRILISQATINLISKADLSSELYAQASTSIPVTITKGSNNSFVWFGYVDPLQFSQGYAHEYESVQVIATDPLGRLQDIKVNEITIINTDTKVSQTTELSPWDCICSILSTIGITNCIGHERINSTVKSALQNTKIKMTVFFGDDKDDHLSCYEILESICNYFNLYIAMKNATSVLLSCETKSSSDVTALEGEDITISLYNSASNDSTSISKDDVFSQIKLKCDIEPVKDIFTALDSKEDTYSDYNNYEKYMTEWEVSDIGVHGWWNFVWVLHDQLSDVNRDDVFSTDHYVYVLRNDKWDFGSNSYINYLGGSIDYSTGTKTSCTVGQANVMNWLHNQKMRCAYLGLAKSKKNYVTGNVKDNSVEDNISLKKYLVISTLGNYDSSTQTLNSYSNILQPLYSNPLCTFVGYQNNLLSPTDPQVTNYIVITGNIILNPLPQLCGQYYGSDEARTTNTWANARNLFSIDRYKRFYDAGFKKSVKADDSEQCYYQQRWMWEDQSTHYKDYNDNILGVYGPLDRKCEHRFKYEYSRSEDYKSEHDGGEKVDKVSKMPVICCQLKIGDKYCVERLDLTKEQGGGQNVFQWMTLEQCEAIQFWNGNSYVTLSPTFTIGIDPKIDDLIIGPSYPIAKSTTLQMNIEKSGMAIPIKASDQLNGVVEFKILGPYNATWKNVTKFHHGWWFWRHAHWETEIESILSNTQSIMIEGLNMELTSDNAGRNSLKTTADNDLVYASNEDPTYNEDKELEIKICTPPTYNECEAWGVKYQNSNSYILNANNTPFLGYRGATKPEECLVDYLYKEYGAPTKILETQLKASAFTHGQDGMQMNNELLDEYYSGIFEKTNPKDPDIYAMLMSYTTELKHQTIDAKFREFKTVFNSQL